MNEKEELSDNEKDISRQFNLVPQEKVDKEITDLDTAFQRIEILEDKIKKTSEEDIKRIEKKINMLYKIVGGIGGMEVVNPISDDDYLDELVPLFNISVETNLFLEYEKVRKLLMVEFKKGEEVKNKLDKLENDYRTGNFLEKEKDKMREMVSNQSYKYETLNKMAERFKRDMNDKKEFRGGFLWLNMRKKLGLISPEEYIEHRKELERKFKGVIISLLADLKKYKKL